MNQRPICFFVKTPAGGHRLDLQQTIPVTPDEETLTVYLPVWIPGSYTRRDFARFLSHLSARDDQHNPLAITFDNPSRWQIRVPQGTSAIYLSYRIYARDLSVRGNYLDHERGYFNPCCACLAVAGRENDPQQLQWQFDDARKNWLLAGMNGVNNVFVFENYHHLIDTPLMFGAKMDILTFDVQGITHKIAIVGAECQYDATRLQQDVSKICHQAFAIFDGFPPALHDDYQFLYFVTNQVYGGLEHRCSSLLMSPRRLLPYDNNSDYGQLLGLFAHEYFHLWNIKDLKPAIYQPYDLQQEQPCDLLWLFEGFTAYFDDWLVWQTGGFNTEEYLTVLSTNIDRYYSRTGHIVQTLADASREAWTKHYNGGEDAPNISTSYYLHGSLFALCLDSFLQQASNKELTLASVMRALWQDYRQHERGLSEETFAAFVADLLPAQFRSEWQDFLQRALHSHHELPLVEACQYFGWQLSTVNDTSSSAGFTVNNDFVLTWLDENSPAALSGLAMGDKIIAIDRRAVNKAIFDHAFLHGQVGDLRDVAVFRDGILYQFTFALQEGVTRNVVILK